MKSLPEYKPRKPISLDANLKGNMRNYGPAPEGWRWRRDGEVVDGRTDLWVACNGFSRADSANKWTYEEDSIFFPIITPETKKPSAPKVSAEVQTLLAKAKMLEDTIATAQSALDKIKEAIRGLT